MKFEPHLNYFLIGQRGIGKSTFLLQLKSAVPDLFYLDLDSEIEIRIGMSISLYFSKFSEREFRILEKAVLAEILYQYQNKSVIALGAGFELKKFLFPNNSYFIQLSRKTDPKGRIFFDRPLWETNKSPLLQSQEKAAQRKPIFDEFCDLYLELPEGFQFNNLATPLVDTPKRRGTIVTLKRWHLERSSRLKLLIESEFVEFIEIRTDLLSYKEYEKFSVRISSKKYFISIRPGGQFSTWPKKVFEDPETLIDCDLTLVNKVTRSSFFILSSHKNLHPIAPPNIHFDYLKWSPQLESFGGWSAAMEWQAQNPDHFILAPRTIDTWHSGRLSEWMRLLLKPHQDLHFIRYDEDGSYPSQPHWLTWKNAPERPSSKFFAVIGESIEHSFSPQLHFNWVTQNGQQFLNIPVTASEAHAALETLKKNGLQGLAVTSPLKSLFEKGRSVNTARISDDQVHFFNTDILGISFVYKKIVELGITTVSDLSIEEMRRLSFIQFSEGLIPTDFASSKRILIFGGGGLLESLAKTFPTATHLPVRKQDQFLNKEQEFDILIWAASPENEFLTKKVKFEAVWDLNYHEFSLAREIAIKRNVPYLSGLFLFIAQGIAQQRFWR